MNEPQGSDCEELLSILEKHEVRYLVIGGYAVMLYSEPRWTKDLDIWIATDATNSKAVFAALRKFGAPVSGLDEKDSAAPRYSTRWGIRLSVFHWG